MFVSQYFNTILLFAQFEEDQNLFVCSFGSEDALDGVEGVGIDQPQKILHLRSLEQNEIES